MLDTEGMVAAMRSPSAALLEAALRGKITMLASVNCRMSGLDALGYLHQVADQQLNTVCKRQTEDSRDAPG